MTGEVAGEGAHDFGGCEDSCWLGVPGELYECARAREGVGAGAEAGGGRDTAALVKATGVGAEEPDVGDA